MKVDHTERRKLTVNESFTLTVHVVNKALSQCKNEVKVFAPGFEVQPSAWNFSLPVKKEQEFKFMLMSKNTGSQVVQVHYGVDRGFEKYELVGYSVRANSYLPAGLSPFVGGAIAFFGPMLTLPWWIEWFQKKQKKAKKKAEEEATKKPAIILP